MCNLFYSTLQPDEICKSCSTRNSSGNGFDTPSWRDHPGDGHQYNPGFNMAPSTFMPVMLLDQSKGSKRNQEGETKQPEKIIQPMMWGLVPHFFKGESVKSNVYKTNNCRVESVLEKKSYIPSLKRGQRCVVLCDGFYEWQSVKGEKSKQPYFIYALQSDEVSIWDRSSWDNDKVWSDEKGWLGPKLLKMAGLYSKWTSEEGEEIMSFTVLTMESSDSFSWLHHRVPAILNTEEEVQKWLDPNIGYEKALANLSNASKFSSHPVSTEVNNSRNNNSSCVQPVSLEK